MIRYISKFYLAQQLVERGHRIIDLDKKGKTIRFGFLETRELFKDIRLLKE